MALAFSARAEEPASDPTEPAATLVALTAPDQALDMPAPASQFIVSDGEKLWNEARARAARALPDQGAGFFDMAERLPDGFQLARGFQAEEYIDSDDRSENKMKMVITAERTERIDTLLAGKSESPHLILTGMRMTQFIPKNNSVPSGAGVSVRADGSLQSPTQAETQDRPIIKLPENKSKDPPQTPSQTNTSTVAALENMLPNGGRVIIRAPMADIDVITNEGRATGGVTIEVFPEPEPGKEATPIAVLRSERLNWRTWSEPSIGSQELAAYTSGVDADSNEPDPVVSGTFHVLQPDGTTATTQVEGRGFVYEVGIVDHLDHIYDEEGREAGFSRTAHNRALFHKQIKMITTATSMRGLLPFQGPEKSGAAEKTNDKKSEITGKDMVQTPKPPDTETPTKTIIVCEGPALFDLAALPRAKAPTNAKQQKTPLSQRYDFLNRVTMTSVPLDPVTGEDSKTEEPSEMYCMHLCMQYPPGIMPSPGVPPEYFEAIGGVKMHGISKPKGEEGQPPPAPVKKIVNCDRIFFDGEIGNMYLVGTPQLPAYVMNGSQEAWAQQFALRTKTGIMTMPTSGSKKMILSPDPNVAPAPPPPNAPVAPKPPAPFSMNLSQTIITWHGTLTREIKHLPVPNAPDVDKDVLTFKDAVLIDIPETGTNFRGDTVRIVRSMPEGELEFLEGTGNAQAFMDQSVAIGEMVSMELAHDKDGNPTKNVVIAVGSRKLDEKATLTSNGTSIRGDKFIVDHIAHTLESFGGAVAMVRMPASPHVAVVPVHADGVLQSPTPAGTEASPAAASTLFKSMSFDMAAPIWIQCDGEFSQAPNGTITTRNNVLIHQPGKQLIADEAFFIFDPPAANSNPATVQTPAPSLSDTSLISGELNKIVCNGSVELVSGEQVLHCDHLIKEEKTGMAHMFMDDPENDVRIYKINSDKTQIISVLKSLDYDGKTGLLKPSTDIIKLRGETEPSPSVLILPYRDKMPAPRDKESSPRRKKKTAETASVNENQGKP